MGFGKQREERQFDTTSLRHIGRDYIAHAFRWGWAARFCKGKSVLDAGCGVDASLARVLHFPPGVRPARYVGIDYNRAPARYPGDKWASFRWEFDLTARYKELGTFERVVSFEVLEHMSKRDSARYLKACRECLEPNGLLLLSTPVFNGKAAANHIHEYERSELLASFAKAELVPIECFGTFASYPDLKRVAAKEHLKLLEGVRAFYSDDLLACFLAPLYPEASRNNAWILKRG